MAFPVSMHLRAKYLRKNVLLMGFFFSPEGDAHGLFMNEDGTFGTTSIAFLQAEMHFDSEANDWKDDWEPELPAGAVPLGPEYPGVWVVGDDDDAEADWDSTLQGSDLADQGAGDGDPQGGDSGDVDPESGTPEEGTEA